MHTDPVRAGTRRLLRAFVGLTSLAVVELLVLADRAERTFAWPIRPAAAAAWLGAAFAAGCLLSLLSLRRHRWSDIRIPVATVAVFTALAAVATLVHAHRLQLFEGLPGGRAAAWLWLGVYLVVPVVCLRVLAQQEARRVPAAPVRRPMPRWLAIALGVQGAVLAVAGVALFAGGLAVHVGVTSVSRFWPWPLTPLSCAVTGAWLIAFGLAAALSVRVRDLSRLLVPAVSYTAFGVLELAVLFRYRAQVAADSPWVWAYAALLVTAVVTGGYGWWAGARRTPGTAESPCVAPAPCAEPVLAG